MHVQFLNIRHMDLMSGRRRQQHNESGMALRYSNPLSGDHCKYETTANGINTQSTLSRGFMLPFSQWQPCSVSHLREKMIPQRQHLGAKDLRLQRRLLQVKERIVAVAICSLEGQQASLGLPDIRLRQATLPNPFLLLLHTAG